MSDFEKLEEEATTKAEQEAPGIEKKFEPTSKAEVKTEESKQQNKLS